MEKKVPFLGVANAYETKNSQEAYAARMACKHSCLGDIDDAGPTVRWIRDVFMNGDDSPYFLTRLSYLAGIGAGVHRERQRRKAQQPMERKNRRRYLDGAADGYSLALRMMRQALEEVIAARDDEELDLEAVYDRLMSEADLRQELPGLQKPTSAEQKDMARNEHIDEICNEMNAAIDLIGDRPDWLQRMNLLYACAVMLAKDNDNAGMLEKIKEAL